MPKTRTSWTCARIPSCWWLERQLVVSWDLSDQLTDSYSDFIYKFAYLNLKEIMKDLHRFGPIQWRTPSARWNLYLVQANKWEWCWPGTWPVCRTGSMPSRCLLRLDRIADELPRCQLFGPYANAPLHYWSNRNHLFEASVAAGETCGDKTVKFATNWWINYWENRLNLTSWYSGRQWRPNSDSEEPPRTCGRICPISCNLRKSNLSIKTGIGLDSMEMFYLPRPLAVLGYDASRNPSRWIIVFGSAANCHK